MARGAVVLFSGGLDSTVTAAFAISQGWDVYGLSILYGQRHSVEIERASDASQTLGMKSHQVVEIPTGALSGSSLTGQGDVPRSRDRIDEGEIPSTYVPARNTVFLALALSHAESLGAQAVFIGANAVDYSGYPDCRPEFLQAFQKVADLGTRSGVCGQGIRIEAPLVNQTKSQIIRLGLDLGVDFSKTHSCYSPLADGLSCGGCESCVIRSKAFAELGLSDPVLAHLEELC